MLKAQLRGLRPRPQTILTLALAVSSFYRLLIPGPRVAIFLKGRIDLEDSVPGAGTDPHEESLDGGGVDPEVLFEETEDAYLRATYLREWEEVGW